MVSFSPVPLEVALEVLQLFALLPQVVDLTVERPDLLLVLHLRGGVVLDRLAQRRILLLQTRLLFGELDVLLALDLDLLHRQLLRDAEALLDERFVILQLLLLETYLGRKEHTLCWQLDCSPGKDKPNENKTRTRNGR